MEHFVHQPGSTFLVHGPGHPAALEGAQRGYHGAAHPHRCPAPRLGHQAPSHRLQDHRDEGTGHRGSIKEEMSPRSPEHIGVKDRSHLRESDSEEDEEEKEEDHSSHEEANEGSEEGGEDTHHGSLDDQEDEEDEEEGHGLSLSQEEEEEEKEEKRGERAKVWVPLNQDHQEEDKEEVGLEEDELPFTIIPNPLTRKEVSGGASSEEESGEDMGK